jgi:hypothetical protein
VAEVYTGPERQLDEQRFDDYIKCVFFLYSKVIAGRISVE